MFETIKGMAKPAVVAITGMAMSAVAFADDKIPDASVVVSSLEALATPIAAVGGAYLGVRVGIRGWKILRSLI
ncbi:hypothetical protein B0682_02660 [Moraxella lincolnii]|uniref:Phage coat protein n=1 Tax=Lwoffella lincolnii TaxID=90241 RepID=A0A1T0CH46_9GAMM|nr:major capsid protein [Moraxella lincolnii]OOS21599.1 hypothetical protein B0682_02660 [Moraxella lincolnii]